MLCALVFRDGRLKEGDELLWINGHSLIGITQQEAVDLLRASPKLIQLVISRQVLSEEPNLKIIFHQNKSLHVQMYRKRYCGYPPLSSPFQSDFGIFGYLS